MTVAPDVSIRQHCIVSWRLQGFDLLFTWHIILIFSPLIASQPYPFLDYLWIRQAIICFSVAAAFLIYPLICQPLYLKIVGGNPFSTVVFFAISIAGGASTWAALDPSGLGQMLAFTALSGLCEGFLMMFWLTNNYSVAGMKTNSGSSGRNVLATLLCFFFCMMDFDTAIIAVSALPVAAAVAFVAGARAVNNSGLSEQPGTEDEESFSSESFLTAKIAEVFTQSRQHFELMIVMTAVFGLSFGLVQSSHLETASILIGATNPAAIFGAVIAYALITLFLETRQSKTTLLLILITSFVAFSIGAAGTDIGPSPLGWTFFGAVVIMGFHFFDFSVLAITIGTAKNARSSPIFRIGINRFTVYFSYGLGFLVGHLLFGRFPELKPSSLALVVSVMLIVVLVSYVIFTFENKIPYTTVANDGTVLDPAAEASLGTSSQVVDQSAQAADSSESNRARQACKIIADTYQLTPREHNVLEYLGRGRNAAFIAQELWISTLTAKTHIANIYRKLDVHSSQELLNIIENVSGENR